MKKTALYQHHIDAGATMTEFAGYTLPLFFSSIRQEHKQVRESVGVFDVSHMGEIVISGHHAQAFLSDVFTGNLSAAHVGTCHYGFMCYEHGGVVDDVIVYKLGSDTFMMVVNAANIDKDYEWLVKQKGTQWQLSLEQKSDEYGQLALQGPMAKEIMEGMIPTSSQLEFFTFRWFGKEDNTSVYLVSRTGYTGEDGFEIIMPTAEVIPFYERLMSKFGSHVAPIGLGARDTLRFEACLPLYGQELTDLLSPVEAGLCRFLTNQNDYVGKDVHQQQKRSTLRRLRAYKLMGKGVPRHGYAIVNGEGTFVGSVTTGYLLEGYDTGRFLAVIDEVYHQDQGLFVQIRNKYVPIEEVKKPFYKKKYKRSE